jgi:ferredoxin
MTAIVDEKLCIGCEHCIHECPDVFSMEGNVACVFVNMVPSDLEKECQHAATACPVDAIQIIP